MTIDNLVKRIIQYDKIEIEDFYVDEFQNGEEVFVVRAKLSDDECYRCPICGDKGEKHGYKQGRIKRWRSLDLGKTRFCIESGLPRVRCGACGVHAQKVPWAIHDSGYSCVFDLRVAYLAAMSPTNLVAKQMRVKWDTAGNCVKRIQKSAEQLNPKSALPTRTAIGETSFKKGHKYTQTVQNLETGEIIWACGGYGKEVLEQFFKQYTPEELSAINASLVTGRGI